MRGSALLGIVNLIECNLASRRDLCPWLAGLFVHPPHRGRGVGAGLVAACERAGRRLGNTQLFLYTERAEEFYAGLGWSTIARADLGRSPSPS